MASVINSPILAPDARLYNIIQSLGLTSGLVLCLDAGDSASYDGTSQTWTDRAAGNNFFRGVDGSATGTDPTFNGVAGAKSASEYFSFDGGDFFKESAAHTFADNWHKNNGAFTILAVYYLATKSINSKVFDTSGVLTVGAPGIGLYVPATRVLSLFHSTSDGGGAESLSSAATLTNTSWNFIAAAYDEATTNADLVVNATAENFTATASSATAAKSTNLRIGARADTPSSPFESGERLACVAAWSTKLTTTQIGNIYSLLKLTRFTSLP